MTKFSKGDKVEWSWGNGTATGKVADSFTSKVERTIKGNKVTRDASKDNPAYMVEQEDGGRALKSESELKKSGGSSGSKTSSSKGSSSSLEDKTKDELYEKAKSQDIEGRSDMSKDELVKALS